MLLNTGNRTRTANHFVLACAEILASILTNVAFAAFTDDVADGVDNTQFTYTAYTLDNASPPFYVATEGVAGGDAVRSGAIGSTSSISAESGFYFDVAGPGTLTFQWKVSGQTASGGVGAFLLYYLSDSSGVIGSNFITGDTGFQEQQISVPTGQHQVLITYIRSAGSVPQNDDAGWVDQLVWTPSGGPDTTPDPFSFTAQTGVALSTVATSNSITISGITAAADIAISACTSSLCEFSINNGPWTSAAGSAAVSDGDTIRVRQTSSADYATTTSMTLDVGGVTGSFDVTTESAPVPVVEGQTATGSGVARAFVTPTTSQPGFTVSDAAFVSAPTAPPPGVTLPHGMFTFTATGGSSGFSVEVTVEYPEAVPAGSSYWKYDSVNGWYTIPATIGGDTVTFTITDNGLGDSNLSAGAITDPGGIGVGTPLNGVGLAKPVPTLGEWSMIILAGFLAAVAWFGMRRLAR